MAHAAQRRAAYQREVTRLERTAARLYDDPSLALTAAAWEHAPRNGNPLPVAECGSRHRGRCCGEGSCCYGI